MLRFNGKELSVTTFPDNTNQVWKMDPELILGAVRKGEVELEWEWESDAEIMLVCQWATLMNAYRIPMVRVKAAYLPYGRQDKAVSNEATFGLTTLLNMLKSCGVEEVVSIDAHPLSFEEHHPIISNRFPEEGIAQAVKDFKPNAYCFPDKSAQKRYYGNLGTWLANPPVIIDKVRDQLTGELKSMEIVQGDPEGLNILIVDDICDAGGTFCWATSILYKAGALNVGLYTTHGLYTAGKQKLYDAKITKLYDRNGLVV